MKTYNLKESLIQMDKDTDFKYTLTDLYEACQLDEAKKKELVQYIDAKDPVGMNAMLCNEAGVMAENFADDDLTEATIPSDWISYGGGWIYPTWDGEWEGNLDGLHYAGVTKEEVMAKIDNAVKGGYTADKKLKPMVNAKGLFEASDSIPSKEAIIDWLSEHKQAYQDAQSFFEDMPLEEVAKEDLISWIEDHKTLNDDFVNFFNDIDEAWSPDLSDCPECGDISFDSKKGRCTKCSYRESLEEAFHEGDMVYVKPSKKSGRVVRVKGDTVEVEIMGGKDPDRRDTFYASDLEMERSLNESEDDLDYSCYNLTDDQIEKVKYIRQHLDTVEGYKAYYELEKEITDEGGCMDIFYDLSADFAWDNRFSVAITRLALADNRPDLADPNYLPGGCYAEYMDDPKYANVLLEDNHHEDYTVEYYLNTAAAERRPTTPDDEEDYIVDTFAAMDDYDAAAYAISLVSRDDIDDIKEDYPNLAACLNYFKDADWGDGSPFVVKLVKGTETIYDSGASKEEFFEEGLIVEDVHRPSLEATLRAAAEPKLREMDYDDDFINEYFGIKLEDTEDDRIKVTVWGELYYEELDELADVLNHIVAEEDPEAYFDHETTGRIVAYIRKDQSEDIPDEAMVAEWSEKFNSCTTWEQLKDVYGEFYHIRDDLNNGTHRALYDIIDKKIDELKPVEESLTEAIDSDIPAPYNKYYEIGINREDIPEEDIPDAFDNYSGMNLLAIVYAKEQYEDALGDNCLDYCYLVEDDQGKMIVTTAGPRVYAVELNEIERCIGDNVEEALTEAAKEAPATIYSMLDAADKYVDNDEYPEGASEEEIIEIAKNNPDCMKVTKWVDGQTGPDEVVWEREVDTWFICQYEGGAEYEHAEGGYYYETLTLVDKETFSSKAEAQKRLAELADEARKEGQDVVAQSDDSFRIKTGRYIGDCEEYHVEAKEGAHASGKKIYEGLNEAILNEINSPEEKPYSAAEIEKEIKSLTQNFTRKKDNLKCGFKEENDAAVKLLKKHYNKVTSEKRGQWFEITFSEPKKELKEDVQNTPVKLASEYFYDNIKNVQDAGWSDVLSFAEDSGWISGSNIIIPAGTVMTLVDQNRYFDVYWVKTAAGDEFIPFNKDFTAESPLPFESSEGLNNYKVTFYMDSLDDNVMSGPSTTKMIQASSEEEAKKKLINSSTDKYYIPTVTKVELVESKSIKESYSITSEFDNLIAPIKDKYPEVDFIINAHTKLGCEVVADSNKERDIAEDEIINITNGTNFKYSHSANRMNKSRGHRAYVNIVFDFDDTSLDESKSMTADEMKAKYGTDNPDIINAGKPEEERVALKEDMIYTDTDGFIGEPGEKYTMSQFRRMWQDRDNDPVMSGYDSFEEWVGETISQMDAHEEDFAPSGRGMASCKIWKDTNGVMGTPGEEYTLNDLADYWTNNNGSDPVLAEYKGDWKAWLDATIPQMEERIDDSLYCEGLESKTFTDKEEAKKFAKENKGAITSVVDDKLNPTHYVHYKGKKKQVKESLFEDYDEDDEEIDIEYIKQVANEYNYVGNIDDEVAELGDDPDTLERMYSDITDVGMVVNQKNLGNWRFLLLSETDFDEPVIETDNGYYVVCSRGSIALVPIEKEEIFGLDESVHEGHKTFADMLNDPETKRANAAFHAKMAAKQSTEDALAKEAKNWPDDKVLTYEEALALAKAYYTQGGDGFYETTEKYQFDDMVDMFGPMTVGSMKRDFNISDSVAKDRMAEGIQLTEAPNKYELLIEPYERYQQCPLVKKTFNSNSLAKVLETIANRWMYGFDPIERAADEGWECETREEAIEALQKEYDKAYTQILIDELEGCNGDGCGFIYYLKNLTTGDMIIDSGIEPEDEEEDLFESAEEASDDYTLSIWNDDELIKDNVWSVSDALEFIHDNGGNTIKVTDHEGERIIWKDGKAVGGGFIGKDIDEYGVTSYFDDGEDVPTHKGAEPFNAWEWMYGKNMEE